MKNLQDDATRFGVSSPEPNTSETQGPQKQQPVSNPQHTQKEQPSSPCQPTVVRYEPPTFSLKMPSEMLTRAERVRVLQNHVAAVNALFSKLAVLEDLINKEPHNSSHYRRSSVCNAITLHVAVKLQQMLEADDQLREAAGLPQLDLPEHLWCVRNMTIAQTREEHFMTITSEIEILCQQTKGKGMYPNLKQILPIIMYISSPYSRHKHHHCNQRTGYYLTHYISQAAHLVDHKQQLEVDLYILHLRGYPNKLFHLLHMSTRQPVDQHAKTPSPCRPSPAKKRRQSITLLQEERRTLFPRISTSDVPTR